MNFTDENCEPNFLDGQQSQKESMVSGRGSSYYQGGNTYKQQIGIVGNISEEDYQNSGSLEHKNTILSGEGNQGVNRNSSYVNADAMEEDEDDEMVAGKAKANQQRRVSQDSGF